MAIKVLYRQSPEAVVSKLSATLSGVLCHTNLVKLIGYGGNEEDEVCLIVYEFLPSLDAKLHGNSFFFFFLFLESIYTSIEINVYLE